MINVEDLHKWDLENGEDLCVGIAADSVDSIIRKTSKHIQNQARL